MTEQLALPLDTPRRVKLTGSLFRPDVPDGAVNVTRQARKPFRQFANPHPVGYPPSGLTDPERIALGDLAVANTMRAMDIDEDAARLLLGGYAEQDRVTISGDRRLVGLFVDETLFAIAERAWLRGLVHPRFN